MGNTIGACEEGIKPGLENVLNPNLYKEKVSLIPFSTHNQKVHLFLEK
jgi:hypothetical protein